MPSPEDQSAVRTTFWLGGVCLGVTFAAAAGMPIVAGVGKEALNAIGGRGDLFAADVMENYTTIVASGVGISFFILVIAALAAAMHHGDE
jgi:hypothetical protein